LAEQFSVCTAMQVGKIRTVNPKWSFITAISRQAS